MRNGIVVLGMACAVALVLEVVGFRAFIARKTGGSRFVVLDPSDWTPAEWIASAFYGATILLLTLGLVMPLTGTLSYTTSAAGERMAVAGILVVASLMLMSWAQSTMSSSWRIGLDRESETELITSGPFRWVRHPIYAAMVLIVVCCVLLVPNALTVPALISAFAWAQVEVRFVEEPFIEERHGTRFTSWAARTGRFVPGVGALRAVRVRPPLPSR